MTGSQSCIDCIGGKFQDLSGQSISKKCGVGKFTTDNRQTGCVQCSAGLYNDEQGQTSCKACLAGTFQSNTGQQLCSQCIAGQYISDLGNSKCLQCPLSRYSDETGANVCSKCPVAKYQDTEGAINCKFCFEVGQAPNKAQTACINPTYKVKSSCKDTEYLDNADPDRDNHVCRTCPAGASCIGWIDWSEVVGKYSKRRRSNVAVIIVEIVFISSFLLQCLLCNHSFPTNPNRITNCFQLFSLLQLTTTLLLLSRYFDF